MSETNIGASSAGRLGSVFLWPQIYPGMRSRTNYGTGKSSNSICSVCGRGGARSFDITVGRTHKKCISPNKEVNIER